MSLDKWKNSKFIVCHHCSGSGQVQGKSCPVCNGYGVGVFYRKTFFYWQQSINSTFLALKKFNQLVNKIFIIFTSGLAVALLGLFAWGYYKSYIVYNDYKAILNWQFWFQNKWFLLSLYISVLLILYLYYRWRIYKTSQFNLVEDVKLPTAYDVSGIQSIEQALSQSENKVDLSQYLSDEAWERLVKAWNLSKSADLMEVTPIFLLGALADSRKIKILFVRLGVKLQEFNNRVVRGIVLLQKSYENKTSKNQEIVFHINLKKILIYAGLDAIESNFDKILDVNFLLSLGTVDYFVHQYNLVEEILESFKIDEQKVVNIVEWGKIKERIKNDRKVFRKLARLKPQSNMNRAMTSLATPMLDKFSKDYTRLAINGYLRPCLNRDETIKNILQKVESNQQSVLLNGFDGVGKTTVIEGLARLMVMEKVPPELQDKRLLYLDVPNLFSSVSPDKITQIFQHILSEVVRAGNIVLVFEDIENLMPDTKAGGVNLIDILGQYLESRQLYVFATVTPKNYKDYISHTKLPQIMAVVNIPEFSDDEAIQVIEGRSNYIEGKHQVFLTYGAIVQAVKLSKRYLYDEYLPAKAFNLLEEVALKVRQSRGDGVVVSGEDVNKLLSKQTGIPLTQLGKDEAETLLNLEKEIHKRIVGQEEAVKMVATSLRRSRAELRSEDRPIANLLFLGPTGVGKTELAKAVAEIYFGGEESMIRFDMSEYQEKSSINRLIGANQQTGLLTEAVRKKPFALLLLDELEKAHPDILNIFLQILDDGRLTDGRGRTIDFTNTIIIATSNAGAKYIQSAIAENKSVEEIKENLLESKLQQYFRPEFINRFDGVMVFKPLTREDVLAIARLLLEKTKKQLEKKQVYIQFTDEAVAEIAELGYDPQYGARPLRRAIQQHVEDTLANYLLSGKIEARDQVVFDKGGEIKVEKVSHF